MVLEGVTDIRVDRFVENPLVTPETDDRIESNINGPSVIRVPEWIPDPLGRYYLYFAHHKGDAIRVAYADDLQGPWRLHGPGVLRLEDTQFDDHIASPDVHVDEEVERIRLYYHGCCGPYDRGRYEFDQVTDVAVSTDGLAFVPRNEVLGNSYFRVWEYARSHYAIANDGHLYRSDDPLTAFDREHELFPRNRHFAVRFLDDDTLQIFLTRRGDRPERIQVAVMDLTQPVGKWRPHPHPPETVLWPINDYEGGDLPLRTSEIGRVDERVRALRDPAVFEEEGRAYLFYAIAGERGIAGAELRDGAVQ